MPERAETTTQAGQAEQPIWPGLTLEAVLYAALVAAAAFMRFYDLGRWPLLTEEARQALAAWRFLQGQGASAGAVPLLFDGALAGFFAFGASDAVARLLPAALGTALVMAPLALRRHLGRWGALAAAFILAFSPTLVFYSRTLAGPVPALAGLAALLWAVEYANRQQVTRARVAAGVGLALSLTSSPWSYTFLLAAALYLGLGWLAQRLGRPWPALLTGEETLRPMLRDGRTWAIAGLLAVPMATTLLLNVGGVQGVVDLLATWLARLVPGSAGRAWLHPLTILGFYEAGVLLLGLVGAAVAWRRPAPLGRFLATWAVLAIALATLSGARDAEPVAMAILPLALLSGLAVSALLARLERPQWAWVGIGLSTLIALLGFWWLQLTALSATYPDALQRNSTLVVLLAVATPVLLAVSIAILHSWVGRTETYWATSVLGLALLAALLLRSGMALNFEHARDAREPLVVAPSAVDLRDMVMFLENWSSRTALDQHTLTIGAQESLGPLIPWYLRDFPLQLIRTPVAGQEYGALVLAAGQDGAAPTGYAGARYLLQTESDDPLGSSRDALAFWLVGTGGGQVRQGAIQLWVKP